VLATSRALEQIVRQLRIQVNVIEVSRRKRRMPWTR